MRQIEQRCAAWCNDLPDMQGDVPTQQVWVVTVTYGDRAVYVQTVIEAVLAAGVGGVVLVDNGCTPAARRVLQALPAQVHCIQLGENAGSAGGYAAGIREAYERGAEFIWLLDDDNRPAPDALARLLAAYRMLGADPDNVVIGFRPSRKEQRLAVQEGRRIVQHANTFMGFHVRQLPDRLFRKRTAVLFSGPPPFPLIPVDYAPYGGILMHRSWVERAGLPEHRLYLYADDHEYTLRLTAAGARLYLCAPAIVEDLDASWHLQAARRFPWVDPEIDLERLYYSVRNRVWLERRFIRRPSIFFLNGAVFLGTIGVISLLRTRSIRFTWRRLHFIWQAMQDGWRGRLGRRR